MRERKGEWFLTYTGRMFWPSDPQPEDFCIEDIAHGLSHICRYGGHCRTFYSVAQHSVLVSHHVPAEDALTALMHDATEAYIGDMIRPIKASMPHFKELEEKLWGVLAATFHLPQTIPESVKHADNRALVTERRDLMSPAIHHLPWRQDELGYTAFEQQVVPLEPREARILFMKRFEQLTRRDR